MTVQLGWKKHTASCFVAVLQLHIVYLFYLFTTFVGGITGV